LAAKASVVRGGPGQAPRRTQPRRSCPATAGAVYFPPPIGRQIRGGGPGRRAGPALDDEGGWHLGLFLCRCRSRGGGVGFGCVDGRRTVRCLLTLLPARRHPPTPGPRGGSVSGRTSEPSTWPARAVARRAAPTVRGPRRGAAETPVRAGHDDSFGISKRRGEGVQRGLKGRDHVPWSPGWCRGTNLCRLGRRSPPRAISNPQVASRPNPAPSAPTAWASARATPRAAWASSPRRWLSMTDIVLAHPARRRRSPGRPVVTLAGIDAHDRGCYWSSAGSLPLIMSTPARHCSDVWIRAPRPYLARPSPSASSSSTAPTGTNLQLADLGPDGLRWPRARRGATRSSVATRPDVIGPSHRSFLDVRRRRESRPTASASFLPGTCRVRPWPSAPTSFNVTAATPGPAPGRRVLGRRTGRKFVAGSMGPGTKFPTLGPDRRSPPCRRDLLRRSRQPACFEGGVETC